MKKLLLYLVTSLVGLFLLTGSDIFADGKIIQQPGSVITKNSEKSNKTPGKTGTLINKKMNNGEIKKEKNKQGNTQKDSSLFSTVKQGGPLMIFIVVLAMVAMIIITERIIYFTKNKIWSVRHLEIKLRSIAEASDSMYREDMEDELRSEFQVYANNTERGLTLLSGIGNISPLAGFLGTVIGMIDAFASIAAATTVNAKIVAVGIQMALVTTAGGLLVAAPTLAFFYFFNHIIQNRYAFADELITDLSESNPRLSNNIEDKKNNVYEIAEAIV